MDVLCINISEQFDVDLAVTFLIFQTRSNSTYIVSNVSPCRLPSKVIIAQLWYYYYAYSVNKLKIAYNDIMRMLLGLPRCHSHQKFDI